jgi:hypothetical protein
MAFPHCCSALEALFVTDEAGERELRYLADATITGPTV